MPPVEVLNDKGPRKTLRFVRNTCYEGVDYGPDCAAGDTVDVDSRWASVFVTNGRAVEVSAAPVETAGHRDPEPAHRDPVVKKN